MLIGSIELSLNLEKIAQKEEHLTGHKLLQWWGIGEGGGAIIFSDKVSQAFAKIIMFLIGMQKNGGGGPKRGCPPFLPNHAVVGYRVSFIKDTWRNSEFLSCFRILLMWNRDKEEK